MLEALAAACIAALVSLVMRAWLYLRGKRRAMQRFYRDRFYDIAERIYRDEALADIKLDAIRAMVEDLDNPTSFGALWAVVSAIESEIGKPGDPAPAPFMEDWIRREFGALLYNYLMAVSYYRNFQGLLLRAKLARVLDPETADGRTETINWRIRKGPLGSVNPPARELVPAGHPPNGS